MFEFQIIGYTMKKIVLDPDNGIVVTKDKTRKKRSTKKGNLIEWFVNVKASKNQLGLILFDIVFRLRNQKDRARP